MILFIKFDKPESIFIFKFLLLIHFFKTQVINFIVLVYRVIALERKGKALESDFSFLKPDFHNLLCDLS